MKKTKWTFVIALLLFACFSLAAQKPADMVGTWEGEATLEGEAEPNWLTLVLELKEGKLIGHMTDEFETMFEAPISEINLEDGTLDFSIYKNFLFLLAANLSQFSSISTHLHLGMNISQEKR